MNNCLSGILPKRSVLPSNDLVKSGTIIRRNQTQQQPY